MIEFSPQITDWLEELEEADEAELSEKERHIVNIVETTQLIEEVGLLGFWQSPINQDLLIKSYDTIGAYELLDLIQSSQWCENIPESKELNETESSHLEGIEEELIPILEDIPNLVDEYHEDED